MAIPGVNIRILRAEISAQAKRTIEPHAQRIIDRQFDQIKQEILEEFDNDPVTQEIGAGANYTGPSMVPASQGNLYSLIGFTTPMRPVQKLRTRLRKEIKKVGRLATQVLSRKVAIEQRISIPTLDSIKDDAGGDSPLAWTSRSWLDLLERGITGLPYYIFHPTRFKNKDYSESGTAIEAKSRDGKMHAVRSGSMPGIPYISKLLNKLKIIIKGYQP